MANVVYTEFLNSLLDSNPSIDFDTDTIRVALVSATYVPSAAHQFYSSVTGVVGTPQQITSPTVSGGAFDGADVTFTAVTGAQVVGLVLYKDTGSAATSPLIAFVDSVASGLPVTPNGGDITIQWDNGVNRILRLVP